MSDNENPNPGVGLETRGLTVRYGGILANAEVDISVAPGEVVGLIGPNGAGKTTFVDAVTGFTPAQGSVRLGGIDLTSAPSHRRRRLGLSRTWQSGELFPNLTVRENVLVALHPGGIRTLWRDLFARRSSSDDEVIDELLRSVGLDDVASTPARDLALGQQKLVGVARALAGRTRVVLLDEPAAGLDSRESAEFAAHIRAVAESGPGVLLIDHDMSLVFGVCDRVYVMEFGKVIFAGTPDLARVDPAVVAAYLGTPMEVTDA